MLLNLLGMVNGLNRMDDTNPFSATAFLLAVKLIDLFNRLYWADSVAVDLNRMGVMAKCTSKATITRARDELVERGVLVIVRKGKKGAPSTYRMNDLSTFGAKNEQNVSTNPVPNPEQYPVPNPVPINRQDYIQDNTIHNISEDDEEEDAFSRACKIAQGKIPGAYKQAFGTDATPAEIDRMVTLVANLHLEAVCEYAIRETALASPRNRFAYLKKLCADWHEAWIRTKEDLDTHQMLLSFVRNPYGEYSDESAIFALDAIRERKERYSKCR